MGRRKGSKNHASARGSLFQYAELAKGGSASHREKLVALTNAAFGYTPLLSPEGEIKDKRAVIVISLDERTVRISSNCAGETPEQWMRIRLSMHMWGHLMEALHSGVWPQMSDGWIDKDGPDLAAIVYYPVVREPSLYQNFGGRHIDRLVMPKCPAGTDALYMVGGKSYDHTGGVYITPELIDEMHRRLREWTPKILI